MSELATRVQNRAAAAKAGVSKTMDEWISAYAKDFEKAIPATLLKTLDPERFLRLALNELRWQPGLRDCDVSSVIGALMTCAQLGLEPSGPLNHVYMVPRNQNIGTKEEPQWVKRVQLHVGYQGFQALAERTGKVKAIKAQVVYENDEFDYFFDGEDRLIHRPTKLGKEKGGMIGAYAVAYLADGSLLVRVVDLDEIEAARLRSEAGRKDSGPWNTDYEAMAMKTAVRRLWKWLPKSDAGQEAFNVDAQVVASHEALRPVLEGREMPVLDVVTETVAESEAPPPIEPTIEEPKE